MVRRLVQLLVGVALYGLSVAMIVRAGLGLGPWDVLHQGITNHTGVRIGTVNMALAVVVMLLWIPLRQWPGLGTVCNGILVGLFMNLGVDLIPAYAGLLPRSLLLVGGVLGSAFATALYIGANLGPGPRDGLMTGLHRVTGRSIRTVRTGIEVTVLALGLLLGGPIGVGTLLFAFGIGPLVHVLMPLLDVPRPGRPSA